MLDILTTSSISRITIDLPDGDIGASSTLKLIGNTLIMGMVENLAASHVLAETSGLGTAPLHRYISAMFPGAYTAYSTRMLTGDYYAREEPLFGVDLALKDVGHALKVAADGGAKMSALEVANGHLKVVKREKGAKGDIAGIYGAVRVESGLDYDNKAAEKEEK
jgi:3-hydroxyisobutyrate dehydrogenase-like beta-hydroxyacid dehydrogenase